MKIVLVAATEFEIAPTGERINASSSGFNKHEIQTLISGVGLVNTTFALTSFLSNTKPDLIIQAGIGGSFHSQLPLTSTCLIEKEYFGDLGVVEHHQFFDLFDKGFMNADDTPFSNRALSNQYIPRYNTIGLKTATGISVNEISTHPERIQQLKNKYNPEIESMEGAALHFVALKKDIPFLQLRSISNFVGERNKENWKMKEAIQELNNTLLNLLLSI